ncbi:pseudouridine synthase [Candidatus Chazhemtobacterium aquaticus]|uniref:Pseudouridine synthase n=1 Tax=Candidatus Chazhemtobacterium aquaticus TaxID=2715735 RepID=A0A857N635_9BACT|nr:pseudouridine synthase [Candidatus Chazhemtobacterium aquaticus]QHO63444.1 Ribosomal large subunit pseudouridine synthase B [Candidatus Chazhemtobacterium aquaticus]
MIRLNKYLSQQGLASRRQADTLISQGKVLVNDQPAKLGTTVDPDKDTVKFLGKVVVSNKPELETYLVYKPLGYVSTTSDPQGRPTVTSLVKSSTRLYPIGRLDQDSEGLILLTNDGDLGFKLTHPKHQIPKTYHALVTGNVTPTKLNRLRRGVMLKDGRTAPAQIEVIRPQGNKSLLSITIFEGRNRQIRRMFSTQKLEVEKLKRVAIGELELGDLKPGDSKKLDTKDLSSLLH